MRFLTGFMVGVVAAGLLIDRGINLPDRLGRLINSDEARQLVRDVGYAIKHP
jgi:hypothetical protein